MLINVKMATVVGILTFMSMINIMLSLVEHKKFYNLEASSVHYKEQCLRDAKSCHSSE